MRNIVITNKEAERAMIIAQRTIASSPIEMMVVGAKSAMIAELKKRMRHEVVEFYFIKKDGALRRAFGTTMSSLAKAHINGNGMPRETFNTTPFFDVEAGEWRSFRYESIVKVC
jgi:hypothetical protein